MATIQSIILTLAIDILLIILIVIGINISMSQNKQIWPPVIGDCPDYWSDQGKGGSKCVVNARKDNIGLATSPMDFSSPIYSGSNGACIKYTWANNNKVSWDGITYGVPNPCIRK
jgi:hypothetical protein